MRTLVIAITSCVISASLFLLASFTGGIVVRTTQPNGLAEVQVPYSLVSFLADWAAWGVLLFGVTLSLAFQRRTSTPVRLPFLGSGLLSGGILAIMFAIVWSLANLQDEGPRCFGGCTPSLQQYYQTVFMTATLLGVLGLIATGLGAWFLVRRKVTMFRSAG